MRRMQSTVEEQRLIFLILNVRSSHHKCSMKKGVLRSFRPQACNFIKKETLAQVFSCEFCEISKNTFHHRTLLVPGSFHLHMECWGTNLQHLVTKMAFSCSLPSSLSFFEKSLVSFMHDLADCIVDFRW